MTTQATNSQAPPTADDNVGSSMDNASVDYDNWYSLIQQLGRLGDFELAVKHSTELAARLPGVHAAVGFKRSSDMPLVPVTSLICRAGVEEEVASWQSSLAPSIRELCKNSDGLHIAQLENGIELISISLGSRYQPEAVVCVFADTLTGSREPLLLCMRLLATEGGGWCGESGATQMAVGTAAPDAEFWDCCRASTTEESFKELAEKLSSRLAGQMVILGTKVGRGNKFRAEAISGSAKLIRPSQLTTNAEELMVEAGIRDAIHCSDVRLSDARHTEAEEQLFRLCNATQIVSGPLKARGTTCGALVLIVEGTTDSDSLDGGDWLETISEFEDVAGCCVDIFDRTRPTLWQRICGLATSEERKQKRRNFAMVAAALVALLAVPLPYRISCRTEVQPLNRRYVPAPYEGILDEVLVEPGDIVKKGQILARMDGREIRWQMSAARAELKRFSKEQDAATAARETSAAQVAELRMQSKQVEIDMLRNRLKNLEIRSPIDGVILGGDPKKMEGARLSLGQTLFETGPLKEMVLEVQIPDRESAYVYNGNFVKARLEAFSHRAFRGRIERVSPQSEMKEDENVFVAQVPLDNDRGLLRPGMAGWAKVSAGIHPLGWNLFHHAVDNVRYWIGI